MIRRIGISSSDELQELQDDIQNASRNIKLQTEKLEWERETIEEISKTVKSLMDKGAEVSIYTVDVEDGMLGISINYEHLSEEVETLLKNGDIRERRIRWSDRASVFKIRLEYFFLSLRRADADEFEFLEEI